MVEDRNLTVPARYNEFGAGVAPDPFLNLIDLELLMHWKDRTYQTFCRSPHGNTVWQSLVPQEALVEPFLMHGILALSAVHLARAKSEYLKPVYINRAASHQNQALAKFRPLLVNINQSNSRAMFAYSCLITVYSFGCCQELHPTDHRTTIDSLCQVIIFARGVHQISLKAADALRDSIFKPVLQWEGLQQNLSEETRLNLERLREAIRCLASDNSRHDYIGAVMCIQDGLSEIFGGFTAVATATRVAIIRVCGVASQLRPLSVGNIGILLLYFASIEA
jgi:hypothetical protein